jgi:hypothetical protein
MIISMSNRCHRLMSSESRIATAMSMSCCAYALVLIIQDKLQVKQGEPM